MTIKPINHQAYWPSSLLTIKPIDHRAYQPSSPSAIEPIDHQAYWLSSLLTIKTIDYWVYQLSSLSTLEPIDHRTYWPSHLSTIKPINHQAYRPFSLSTIKPIDHWAYQPLTLSTIKPIDLWSSFATFKPFGLFQYQELQGLGEGRLCWFGSHYLSKKLKITLPKMMKKSFFQVYLLKFLLRWIGPNQQNLIYFPPTPGVPNSEKYVDNAFESIKYSHFQKVVILSILIQSFKILPKV